MEAQQSSAAGLSTGKHIISRAWLARGIIVWAEVEHGSHSKAT